MRKIVRLILCVVLMAAPVLADVQCDKSVVISVTGSNTTTLVAAQPNHAIKVCGFVVTGDVNNTTAQFKSGTTNLTGAIVVGQNGVSYGGGTGMIFQVPEGAAITLTAGTGSVFGILTFQQ